MQCIWMVRSLFMKKQACRAKLCKTKMAEPRIPERRILGIFCLGSYERSHIMMKFEKLYVWTKTHSRDQKVRKISEIMKFPPRVVFITYPEYGDRDKIFFKIAPLSL